MKNEIVIIADYSTDEALTLQAICEICGVTPDIIQTFIEYGVIYPDETGSGEWVFRVIHLQRVKRAIRLQRDLELNLAGAALVLDLLDEVESLREQLTFLQKNI